MMGFENESCALCLIEEVDEESEGVVERFVVGEEVVWEGIEEGREEVGILLQRRERYEFEESDEEFE